MTERLKEPTFEDWEAATPRQKGYLSYMYAARNGSDIPDSNPFELYSEDWISFQLGQQAAVLEAQDSEE